jgi:hypothetical protein
MAGRESWQCSLTRMGHERETLSERLRVQVFQLLQTLIDDYPEEAERVEEDHCFFDGQARDS